MTCISKCTFCAGLKVATFSLRFTTKKTATVVSVCAGGSGKLPVVLCGVVVLAVAQTLCLMWAIDEGRPQRVSWAEAVVSDFYVCLMCSSGWNVCVLVHAGYVDFNDQAGGEEWKWDIISECVNKWYEFWSKMRFDCFSEGLLYRSLELLYFLGKYFLLIMMTCFTQE